MKLPFIVLLLLLCFGCRERSFTNGRGKKDPDQMKLPLDSLIIDTVIKMNQKTGAPDTAGHR